MLEPILKSKFVRTLTFLTSLGIVGCGDGVTLPSDKHNLCKPGTVETFYSGPENTFNKGICRAGFQLCEDAPEGAHYVIKTPEILPEPEICDGLDNNCNGQTDEDVKQTFFKDSDQDQYGNPNQPLEACEQPEGYVNNNLDCKDGNKYINPNAVDVCDGVDNNCDGTIDKGCECTNGTTQDCGTSDVGECEYGTQSCLDGFWGECYGAINGTDELCDNLDNDCDGEIDENLIQTCSTICGEGMETCVGGTWQYCDAIPPLAERCDGHDNDCDGIIDNDLNIPFQLCTAGEGECTSTGLEFQICLGEEGWSEEYSNCTAIPGEPSEELCDNKDNNCNSQTDENFNVGETCTIGVGECVSTGSYVCASNQTETVCDATSQLPTNEVCDSLDNNCNGEIDEELIPPSQECTVDIGGCISHGLEYQICLGEEGWSDDFFNCDAPLIYPTSEICDGIDNDCNSLIDDNLSPPFQICIVGEGECASVGIEYKTCQGSDGWSPDYSGCTAVPGEPADELCDNLDNDCNGEVDNGFNVGESCVAGDGECQAEGQYVCTSSGLGTICDAIPGDFSEEICDGLDNNCDGEIDEGVCTTLIVYDDMEDGVIDWNKWTLLEDYNSEHGSGPPPGFAEQDGALVGHSSFSYSGDQAWYRFNTFNSNTGEPAFDFQQPSEINIDSFLRFIYNDSCFGVGFGEYYLTDESGNKAAFHRFDATSNGYNLEETTLRLEKDNGQLKNYHDDVFQGSVDISNLEQNDRWSIEFYTYLASSGSCSDSAYMDIWLDEISYVP